MLKIKQFDIERATLPISSGNEGWIGVAPSGEAYHIVVPVDTQIARGVNACNMPTDGTPFGGYSGWIYLRVTPYDPDQLASFEDAVKINSENILTQLRGFGIEADIQVKSETQYQHGRLTQNKKTKTAKLDPQSFRQIIVCPGCGESWNSLSKFLRNENLRFTKYRPNPEDFRLGAYIFNHSCGAEILIQSARLVARIRRVKSLINSHACPGLCSYEFTSRVCAAECEGSIYRRVAAVLKARNKLKSGSKACAEGALSPNKARAPIYTPKV